jgi:hypothetical protein
VLPEHVWPSGQFASTRHPTQTWFVVSHVAPPPVPPPPASVAASPEASLVPASASATQSRFDLQPGAQAEPAQYWPVGQLSLDGRHCTQVSFVVSHQGVAPWHCELTVHSTHDPALHTSPVGQGCVEVHPGTHAFALQTVPEVQSLVARHATQVSLVVLHLPVGAVQSLSCRHATQALVVVSQTVPVGQVLVASQPVAQALLTQRCPALQSADVRHATHEVCASHFCPAGQSAFEPHTSHVPLTHTCPLGFVAQSAFDWHPPRAGASPLPVASPPAPSPPVEASLSEVVPRTGAPELAQPDGKKSNAAARPRRATEARKRRSRTMQRAYRQYQVGVLVAVGQVQAAAADSSWRPERVPV